MIAPVEQYIIDQVRDIRNKLKITAEDLSEKVSPSGSGGFIGNIESAKLPAVYTDHSLNIIARIFTEHAASLNDDSLKKEYTLYDFYPKNKLDDLPIEKHIEKIPLGDGPTKGLYNLIKSGKALETAQSITQITDEINKNENTAYKTTNITSSVHQAVKTGVLERVDLAEGKVGYKVTKKIM